MLSTLFISVRAKTCKMCFYLVRGCFVITNCCCSSSSSVSADIGPFSIPETVVWVLNCSIWKLSFWKSLNLLHTATRRAGDDSAPFDLKSFLIVGLLVREIALWQNYVCAYQNISCMESEYISLTIFSAR